MQFLCLAYYDDEKFNAMSKDELDALVAKCHVHDQALRAGGRMTMVASLAAPGTSKSIRPKNGRPSVTDGPYAEAKECLGSFFIIEAKDLDEATAEASKHPAAHLGETLGWGIEVRPIDVCRAKEGRGAEPALAPSAG
jgi:hypothetical protein